MAPSILMYHQNSIKHHSFVYIQLNDKTVLFLTIQFSISHLFAQCLNVKQFYLTHWYDPSRCYHSSPEWAWEQSQWRTTMQSPNLQDWSLSIRGFNVISRTLIGGVLPLYKDTVGVLCSPSRLGYSYLPTPPLGQDMTHGQFLNGV